MSPPPIPNPISFKKTGHFYDMILAYSAAIAGLEGMALPSNPLNYRPDEPGIGLAGKVYKTCVIYGHDIWSEFQTHSPATPNLVDSLYRMLVNTAYESISHLNDRSPIFEFFRHIRNASSHGGIFNFSSHEPARPANWRGVMIDHNLHGRTNSLFGSRCFLNFLGPADPILLLWDVEQHTGNCNSATQKG